jgi:hypothetical protein
MSTNVVIEVVGWAGVTLILTAYFLVSFQFLLAGSVMYLLLNVVGGGNMIIYSYYKKSFQPLLLNAVWVTIALLSFVSILL